MWACPYCKEEIKEGALKCRFCQSMLPSGKAPSRGSDKVTYVIDADLIRFAKFAIAILGIFTIVGLSFFGFDLKDMAQQLADAQSAIATNKSQLEEAQVRMNAGLVTLGQSEKKVEALQLATESIKQRAEAAFQTISQRETRSRELLIAIETRRGSVAIETVAPAKTEDSRGASLWPLGTSLRVAFIGGDEPLHQIARESAAEWTKHAAVSFEFDAPLDEADIRISFEIGHGSWSFVGRDALIVSPPDPTMNIDPAWDRAGVTSHFGYVLGLLKEHQNPTANIPWDREEVHRHFGEAPYFWDKATIDHNFFRTWPPKSFPLQKEYDPASIMHQAIPNEFTLGDHEVVGSSTISPGDAAWATRLYPKRK